MRVGSPGARVGHAWLNVDAMNGMSLPDASGKGIANGTFGFVVADVGRGGKARSDDVRPGMSSVTTFCIDREFCKELSIRGGRKENTVEQSGIFYDPRA